MMKNKSSIMLFSAVLILIFHLWITVWQGNVVELFIQKTSYVGVDIFFFLSAYSLAKRERSSAAEFLRNRFLKVYLKFFLFSIVGMIVFRWGLPQLIQVISGVELMRAGGGAFLWFLPAIMLFYVLYCVFYRCDKKNAKLTLMIFCLLWVAVSLLVTYAGLKQLGIMLNRIPIFLIGYYVSKYRILEKLSPQKEAGLGVILSVIGCVFTCQWGFMHRIQVPFIDSFYLTAIPLALGMILLINLIPSVKPIKILGSATLEMYAMQMIFGYKFAGWMIKQTNQPLLINACSMVFVMVCAVALHFLFENLIKKSCKEKMLDTRSPL